jgi:hypothetical protein
MDAKPTGKKTIALFRIMPIDSINNILLLIYHPIFE